MEGDLLGRTDPWVVWRINTTTRRLALMSQFRQHLLDEAERNGGTIVPPVRIIVPAQLDPVCHFLYDENEKQSNVWTTTLYGQNWYCFGQYFFWFWLRLFHYHRTITSFSKFQLCKLAGCFLLGRIAPNPTVEDYWKTKFPIELRNKARSAIEHEDVSFSEAMLISHAVLLQVVQPSIDAGNAIEAAQPTAAETFAIRLSKESPTIYAKHICPLFELVVNNRLTLIPRVVTPTKSASVDESDSL